MTTTTEAIIRPAADERAADLISGPMTLLFAIAVGVIVTNLFAPQTLVGLIGPSLGIGAGGSGLVATATLLGYAAGLFLLVPLADLVENRRLIVRMLVCAVLAASLATLAPTAGPLLVLLFLLGAACSAIQILVPIAAAMAPADRRGRVIGDVMGGLMVGILLARPVASFIADVYGWRAFYGVSALAMAALTLVLALRLPQRRSVVRSSYPALIASLWHLLRAEPILRRRALTASLAMAAFSLFWTAVALRLSQPPFELSQRGIALFALAGAGGAVVTPLFGRAGDRGWTRPATIASHLVMVAALALAAWAGSAGSGTPLLSLLLMGASAVLLDVGVTGDQTLGRRAINLLQPEARGRINGLFVGLFFLGGAVGSGVAGAAWTWGGWPTVCAIGAAFGVAALLSDLVERRG
ncbi:MAG TPA: MFS transporter [Aliidongia sp.]|uniref:MFS transporter n=1 Tax=Aliidongia sp. TaxID=1914230 RepID=UPI002DDD7520|nr:MFS transporter [Aliidongia sp.]HEV2675248.1 MFS transporter [Aliidongia sp.]